MTFPRPADLALRGRGRVEVTRRSARSALPTVLTSSSRRARWRRAKALRLGCALLGATAVWLVGSPLLPHEAQTGAPVVVLARDLAIGSTLSADDVRVERRPLDQRPTHALDRAEAAIGRVAARPLSEGEVLTGARFQGQAQLAGLGSGRVAVSVPLVESGLLPAVRPADLVEVLAAGTGQTVASRAPVLSVERPAEGVLGPGADGTGHIVLALTGEEARAVAATITAQTGPAGFVLALRGP